LENIVTQSQRPTVIELTKAIVTLLGHDNEAIYARDEWGSKLTFNAFKADFERLFGLGKIFQNLPFELLPDANLNLITQAVTKASTHLQSIDDFDVSTAANSPQEMVQSLGSTVQTHADAVTVQMGPWISYLAYQKGDVSQNITNLMDAIARGENLIGEAKGRIEKDEEEIKRIVQQAQDFAGDKGVTIFTEQFNTAASDNAVEADNWLKVTVGIFVATIVAVAVFMYQLVDVTNPYEWISRATLIGLLISGVIWCGKNYRIIRHQQSVNRHKANGLKSFLLFRDAADNDETTRNTVLLETTKAIFSTPDSGFVPSTSTNSGSEIRIVDSTRAVAAATTVARGTRATVD
jgi:hypothetical protein